MSRRELDFYETPSWATRVLLDEVSDIKALSTSRTVLEPCHGKGAITDVLRTIENGPEVITNDIDPSMPADCHGDAAYGLTWRAWSPSWTITNPPFTKALEIAQLALARSTDGIALLLRLTFLEPTKDRGEWLYLNPPHELIVLPRISFTGDGNTDSVTCAWMVWHKQTPPRRRIVVIPKPRDDRKRALLECACVQRERHPEAE